MRGEYLKTVETRLKLMGLFVLAVGGLLFWRMFDLQIIKHDHYLAMAQDQQRFEKVQVAQRGRILVHDSSVDDTSYYPLALDIKSFAVWAVPRQIKDKNVVAEALSPLIKVDRNEIFNQINNDKMYIPPLKRGLSFDEAADIRAKSVSGILVIPEYNRFYPEGALASQTLGFVNSEGEGKYGFEGHYNDELKGKEGVLTGEKDTLGRVISLLTQDEPKNGANYVLTIDRSVQYFVEKKLAEALVTYKADSGTIVIMDIESGGILAMANLPSYDPNDYKNVAKANQNLFVNPAITSLYEPGSIFKPLVMSAAIDKGVVTPETEGDFGADVVVDGFTIRTAERKAFGRENMTQVLQNSDNVAMVWISEKMGKENLYAALKSYNFLDKTGIDLDGETSGYTTALKQWKDINRSTISFGQGIAVTPIQLVAAYAAMGNGGVYVEPHVVDKISFPGGSEKKIEKEEGARVISADTAKKMAEMLYNVVEKGHSWRAKVPGFKVGAKTGTAQIPKPEGGYEESEDGLGIYIHSLAGLAPTDNPKFAMLVKLDRPKSARYSESTAAPLFGEISSFLLNYHYRSTPTEPFELPHAP